jgi:hypothetical protein
MQLTYILCWVLGFVMVFAIVEEIQVISEGTNELLKSDDKPTEGEEQPEVEQSKKFNCFLIFKLFKHFLKIILGGEASEAGNSTSLEIEPAAADTNRTLNETVHVKPKRIACIRYVKTNLFLIL